MKEDNDLLQAVLRNDLTAFAARAFREIAPGTEFLSNWHIDAIAYHLQECVRGNITRLIITVPPRYMKSILASVAFPAFVLGNDPTRNIICASYSDRLAGKHARDFRSVVATPWYSALFPSFREGAINRELEFVTTLNGGRLATSVDGTLTGLGGDFIIIDDPIKPDEAMSEAERIRVIEWFRRTLSSRLNNKKDGVIIIVMQRVHVDDLVGHVLGLDNWTVLNIPAIAPAAAEYRFGDGAGQVYRRTAGEMIDPRREGIEELNRARIMMGTRDFEAQYQQNPLPADGNLVHRRWFRSYEEPLASEDYDGIVHSWDTATEAGEMNDYSVCTVWGVKDERYYLIEVVREKLEYPELRKRAVQLVARDRPQVVLIEKAGTGRTLLQDLRREIGWITREMNPRGDKETRMAGQSALIEQGRVYLPSDAPWLGAFLQEVTAFPSGRHDDQVDSLEQFLRFMRCPYGIYPGAREGRSRPRSLGRERPEGRRCPPPRRRTYSLREVDAMVRGGQNLP